MSAESEKLPGIAHPDFCLGAGQTYAENILARQKINRIKDIIDDRELQRRVEKIVAYLEDYAIPFALKWYQTGERSRDKGSICWFTDYWSTKITIEVFVEGAEFFVETKMSTYYMYEEIAGKIKSIFSKVPGVTIDYEGLRYRSPFVKFIITLSIQGINK